MNPSVWACSRCESDAHHFKTTHAHPPCRQLLQVDVDVLSVEHALFRSFDADVRQQLDPIWHRVSFKSKQLINDARMLRRLLEYLLRYDCVTFLSFIESVVLSEYSASTSSNIALAQQNIAPWLFMEAADTVIRVGAARYPSWYGLFVYCIYSSFIECSSQRSGYSTKIRMVTSYPSWKRTQSGICCER